MSVTAKVIVSLVIAALAATVTSTMLTGGLFSGAILAAFIVACLASALIGTIGGSSMEQEASIELTDGEADSSSREFGQVKWFNVSKGFGFIIKEDGEEIFVHFRSIRGSGRRGLRDGQRVSFVTAQSDKGPQAEDVLAE